MRVVLHKGPIPGTDIGHRWFTAGDGCRYAVFGWPHGINKGWGYEILDVSGRQVEDGLFSLDEVRKWAVWTEDDQGWA